MKRLLTVLTAVVLLFPAAVYAQLRPGAFTTVTLTDTSADSLHVGCAVGSSTCTGGFKAGKGIISAGMTVGATTAPPTIGILFGSGAPVSTTNALYQIAGVLYFNGSALASGSSVSGTTGTISIFTGPTALGDSIITQAAGVVMVGGSQTVSGTFGVSGATTLSSTLNVAGIATFINTGLHVLDTNASHDLIITPGSDLTSDRILTITTGDAARTVTLSGNPTLSDWFDQSVKAAATPGFAGVTVVPGTSAITGRVPSVLYTSVTSTGNSGSGETTLYTQAVAANTLATNGDTIIAYIHGVGDSGADTKTINIKYNGVTIGTRSDSTNFGDWSATAYIVRTGATSQSITTVINIGGSTTTTHTTGSATLSGATTFAVTGQGASSDQVTIKDLTSTWLPAGS